MSERRGRGGRGRGRNSDEWRTVNERPEARDERRAKQSQNRKSRREASNARLNVDQLTQSPGLTRNSGSSTIPVPFFINPTEKAARRSRGGKRSRSNKKGVGAFDPSNPSGNFSYRANQPGSRGRGRAGAPPPRGRGGSSIYVHGHGYVNGKDDVDEVYLESTRMSRGLLRTSFAILFYSNVLFCFLYVFYRFCRASRQNFAERRK